MCSMSQSPKSMPQYSDSSCVSFRTSEAHLQNDISGVFGKCVRTVRKNRGYTQEKLAEETGVSVDTIKRVEDGMGTKIDAAYRIAVALNTPLGAFFPEQTANRDAIISSIRLLLDRLEGMTI